MLCVSRDWPAGGSAKGSRGSRDGGVKTREAVFLTLSVFSFQSPLLKEFWRGGLECQALRAHLLKCRPAHSITESLWGEHNLA